MKLHAPSKIISAAALSLLVSVSLAARSDAMTSEAPPITVNGTGSGAFATERDGSVFVPVRSVFDKLGATATVSSGAIVVRRDGATLAKLTVGSRSAEIDGTARTLPFAPFTSGGRVMVPLRVLSEAAGATVAYRANPRSVSVEGIAPTTPAKDADGAAAAVAPVAVAPAAVAADATATTAATSATTSSADNSQAAPGIPWWVWLLLALVILALLLFFMRRTKKDPLITTKGSASLREREITTRR